MYERHTYRQPERMASPGRAIGPIVLTILAIVTYLIISGSFSGGEQRTAVYLPQVSGRQ